MDRSREASLGPTASLDKSVRDKILPLMKDYVSTYAQPLASMVPLEPTSSLLVVAEPTQHAAPNASKPLPAATHHKGPSIRRSNGDASTVLFNPQPHLQTQSHANIGGPLRPLRLRSQPPTPAHHGTARTDEMQRFACMHQWMQDYPCGGGGPLSVQQWAPFLLRDLNKELDPSGTGGVGPKPNALRVAASMHVVKAAFHALHIPTEFFEDLESAVYVAHSGKPPTSSTGVEPQKHTKRGAVSHSHLSGDAAPSRLDVGSDMRPIPRLFTFEALNDATVQRRLLANKAVAALSQFDTLHRDISVYEHKDKEYCLQQHFVAWRCATRVATTYRRAATLQRDARMTSTWKRIVFYSWKAYVSLSRVESELEHLQVHVDALVEKHQVDMTQQAAVLRKQMDAERRAHDDEITEIKATQLTPEMRRQHEDRLLQLKHAETQNVEDKRYIAATEAKLKDLVVFREQCSSVLRGTVDRLHQTIHSLLGRRRLDGVRAAAVIAVAYRLEAGTVGSIEDMLDLASKGSSSLDVVQPPISCSALSVLLAWANIVLGESLKRSNPGGSPWLLPLRAVGIEFADAMLYAALWRAVDPDAAAPPRIEALSDAAVRMRTFHSEFEEFLLDAAAEGTTAEGGAKRGWKAAAAAVSKQLRWSAMTLANVSVESLLSGDTASHTMVLFLLMQLYHTYHLPNVTEQLDPSSYAAGSLSQRVRGVAPAASVESLDKLEEFGDALRDQCTVLHFSQRSVIAWRTVCSHVEADILGRTTSTASATSVASLLLPNDKRLPHFTVRGLQMLAAMDYEARNLSDAALQEGAAHPTSSTPVDERASPTLRKASTVALQGGNTAEDDEDMAAALERLAEVIPSSGKRQELFLAMERYAGTIADVYCSHSGGTARLRMPQCQRLLVECCIPVLEDVLEAPAALGTSMTVGGSFANLARAISSSEFDRASLVALPTTQQQVLDRYLFTIRTDGSSGKAFTPLSFMLMLAELAVLIGGRSPQTILEGARGSGAATPAKLFEALTYQYFACRVAKPIFSENVFRGVHQVPFGLMAKQRSGGDIISPPFLPQPLAALVDAPLASMLTVLWEGLPVILPTLKRGASAQQVWTFDEFTKLWKELEVGDGGSGKLSPADAKCIFQFFAVGRAFTTEDAAGGGGGGKSRGSTTSKATSIPNTLVMSVALRDFVDVLAMVSAYTHPSPLYSYMGRLKAFLGEKVLPVVKRKFPAIPVASS